MVRAKTTKIAPKEVLLQFVKSKDEDIVPNLQELLNIHVSLYKICCYIYEYIIYNLSK